MACGLTAVLPSNGWPTRPTLASSERNGDITRTRKNKTEYLKQRRGQLRGFWESSHSTNTNSILGKAGKLENKMALASKTGKGRLFALHFPPTKKKPCFQHQRGRKTNWYGCPCLSVTDHRAMKSRYLCWRIGQPAGGWAEWTEREDREANQLLKDVLKQKRKKKNQRQSFFYVQKKRKSHKKRQLKSM